MKTPGIKTGDHKVLERRSSSGNKLIHQSSASVPARMSASSREDRVNSFATPHVAVCL